MSIALPDPVPAPSETSARETIYQQALHDFALTDLLTRLQNFSSPEFQNQPITEPESELIAALLVEYLANSLNSRLVAAYLKAIRQGNREVIPEPINLEYPESTDLPANFPTATPSPRFIYGDCLRLCQFPINGETETQADTGRCIGRYYAYAPHHLTWMWKYVVWLSKDSVSAPWCIATTAWEDGLELLTQEEQV